MVSKKIKSLGEFINQSRKKQGLTQEQLAAISGVGVRFVRELEHGKESCHIGKAFQVASMLGLDITVGGKHL